MTPAPAPFLSLDTLIGSLQELARALDANLVAPLRDDVLSGLRRDAESPRATLQGLTTLALLDDYLRVVHLAIAADGKIDTEEIETVYPLVYAAAGRYAALRPGYEQFEAIDHDGAGEFLRAHRHDARPFGFSAASVWRGMTLCRQVSAASSDRSLERDHERMLLQLMDEILGGRNTAAEQRARRELREILEQRYEATGPDPRIAAFCRPDSPEIFGTVEYATQIFEPDPLDVEEIYGEARETFNQLIERATARTGRLAGHGQMLLVLGQAGSGKTHLLRAFRNQLHGRRRGYAGYLQMTSDAGDYAQYVLANLVDSLERPYDKPELASSGLMYLSDALVEQADAIGVDDLERLRTGEFDAPTLGNVVGELVDRIVRLDRLDKVDTDLLHALLLLQRRDPALDRRVVKFLRCEPLTAYEQNLLGGLSPRLRPEDPLRLIEQIGRLMADVSDAALVLLVDQVEDVMAAGDGPDRFQRAVDVLRQVTERVESSIVVLACLHDLYSHVKGRLTQSARDRLENDPSAIRLTSRRTRDEINAIVRQRLENLWVTHSVAARRDDPLFPIPTKLLDDVANDPAREVLAACKRYHDACIASGGLATYGGDSIGSPPPPPPPPPPVDFDREWNDRCVAAALPSDDDDGALLGALAAGLEAARDEVDGLTMVVTRRGDRVELRVTADGKGTEVSVLALCNRRAQGGGLGNQIDDLMRTRTDVRPVALRTSGFQFGPKARITQQVAALIQRGGRLLAIENRELRALVALQPMLRDHGTTVGFAEWRGRKRPIGQLALIRALLDVDEREPTAASGPSSPIAAPPPPPAGATSPELPPEPAPPPSNRIRIGVTATLRADPVTVDLEDVKRHAVFLGTTGSGKTTLALCLIEQLLERGVSALLIDRKGDLARYGSAEWWSTVPADPRQAARKRALRDSIDLSVYTPGDPTGRPLALSVIPHGLGALSGHEREQAAKIAAAGLAAMMGYGKSESHRRREAILKKAIEHHAERGGTTLDDLRDAIARPDPALLADVGVLTRHFAALAEDLTTLDIQRGSLLAADGEILDAGALFGDGRRPRLTIISTYALAERSVLQFWVSRLLVEIARWVRSNPQKALQAIAMFDEADLYVPAVSSPPTKEPMFELLRRARSGGLGMMLASQNPGDFDYVARENVNTWFVGRITQGRGVEKMKALLGEYPQVTTRLAAQPPGAFFLLQTGSAAELKGDRAMMETAQMSEPEIASMARALRDVARR